MAKKRDFLAISDFSRDDLTQLLERACSLKSGVDRAQLTGKTLAMIFRKSSTRTRVSFQVGMSQLGGHAIFLSDSDSQIGRGESVHDTAKVLSRYVDGIMIRTFAHAEVEEFARHASVPVINGLTDLLHPCQIIADLQTMAEEFGREHAARTVAWIGDGNNMCNSYIEAAIQFDFQLRVACPEGYEPDSELLAKAGDRVRVVRDPREAVSGAHLVSTDVWASMGQEEEEAERMEAFETFLVDESLMGQAAPSAIFLHCLPAHRGEEVTAGVIDGPQSRIFDEAENRLHAQKAIMLELMA